MQRLYETINSVATSLIIFLLKTPILKKFLVLVDFLYFDSAWGKSDGETRFVNVYWVRVLDSTKH